MVLVDTTVLVDVLRGHEPAVAWMLALEEVPICSEVNRVEVLRGVRSGERRATARLLAGLKWMPVDGDVSRQAGEFGRRYRRSHPGLGVADLIVAATATTHDAELATSNLKHFPMFTELRPPY